MNLKPYNSLSTTEVSFVREVFEYPLSGYLGGELAGGKIICQLEEEWAAKFGVKHAIACNSATSGLLIACMAAGVNHHSTVLTTPYTMSATAAAPKFLGADVVFDDIEAEYFSLHEVRDHRYLDAIVVTNLFGHPGRLEWCREWCDRNDVVMIEDNAQAPLAMENRSYAGTIGHIGVFSLNVHKHIQCGEGGVCVTNDDNLATKMRLALNHGEMAGHRIGLNLRMTEVTAAIALSQLRKIDWLVSQRVEIAKAIIEGLKDLPGIRVPPTRENCRHVYYCIGLLAESRLQRDRIVDGLTEAGVPVRRGYLKPLYTLPAFTMEGRCPVTEDVESRMILYENCAWTPTSAQIKEIHEIFKRVTDNAHRKISTHAHSEG